MKLKIYFDKDICKERRDEFTTDFWYGTKFMRKDLFGILVVFIPITLIVVLCMIVISPILLLYIYLGSIRIRRE